MHLASCQYFLNDHPKPKLKVITDYLSSLNFELFHYYLNFTILDQLKRLQLLTNLQIYQLIYHLYFVD
jgi:hypothetical protein